MSDIKESKINDTPVKKKLGRPCLNKPPKIKGKRGRPRVYRPPKSPKRRGPPIKYELITEVTKQEDLDKIEAAKQIMKRVFNPPLNSIRKIPKYVTTKTWKRKDGSTRYKDYDWRMYYKPKKIPIELQKKNGRKQIHPLGYREAIKEKMICECGKSVSIGALKQHSTTPIHFKLLIKKKSEELKK